MFPLEEISQLFGSLLCEIVCSLSQRHSANIRRGCVIAVVPIWRRREWRGLRQRGKVGIRANRRDPIGIHHEAVAAPGNVTCPHTLS